MAATCRSCGAPIVWAEMAATGSRMPLDEEEVTTGAPRFKIGIGAGLAYPCSADEPGHVSHFATCPNAAQHRKPR